MTDTLVRIGDVAGSMFARDLAEHDEYMAFLDSYKGAKPLGPYAKRDIYPFMDFDVWHRREIASIVLLDESPPKRWHVGEFTMCESRAWFEWHWHRGIDPLRRKPDGWDRKRALVIERDGYVCGLCGGDVLPEDVHIDHIKPRSLGGSDEVGNLQVAHSTCNLRKGNRV